MSQSLQGAATAATLQLTAKPSFWRIQGIESDERDDAVKWLTEQVKELGLRKGQGFSLAASGNGKLCATLTSRGQPTPSYPHWLVDREFIGFTPLNDPDNAVVDIVAVTGLGGHALGSFRSKDGRAVWLRDFAPQREGLQGARFITYGYRTAVLASDTDQGVHELARELLDGLAIFRRRTQTQERPLCFVCHSLGGVVLKETLLESSKATDARHCDLHKVVLATCGLVFFGVPNQGMRHDQLMTVVRGQPNEDFIRDLLVRHDGEASQFLRNMAREFKRLCRQQEPPWNIISYYERLRSSTIEVSVSVFSGLHLANWQHQQTKDGSFTTSGEKVFMVTSRSASITSDHVGDFDHHSSDANHRDLVRFDTSHDTRYVSVIDKLEKMAVDATRKTSSLASTTRTCRGTGGSPSIPGQMPTSPSPGRSELKLHWLSDPELLLLEGGVSECAPALAPFGADLVAVWRAKNELGVFGLGEHNELYWAKISQGTSGTPMRSKIRPFRTGVCSRERPGLAALQEKLVALWKGVDDDTLYFSTLRLDSLDWSSPMGIANARSSGGPALAPCDIDGRERVYAAWKGADSEIAYLSWYDGEDWREPLALGFVQTDANVSLVCYDGKVTISWKVSKSPLIRFMRLDENGNKLGSSWVGDDMISSFGPALAVIRGTCFAAWRGQQHDDVWLTSWIEGETHFKPSQIIPNSSTDQAPTLVGWDNWLVVSWRGRQWNTSMWWKYGEAS